MNKSQLKTGAITLAELLHTWATVAVDQAYAQPLLTVGEGFGLEVHTQSLAQLARVSEAIDSTIQACYITAHSSQSASPASGDSKATVTITVTRSTLVYPTVLAPGYSWVEEVQTDSGENGPVEVRTGRRYTPTATFALAAGEAGPLTFTAVAEYPGKGYNNPRVGTLSKIDSPGAHLENTTGTLATTHYGAATLTMGVDPDVITVAQVGMHVVLMNSPNQGLVARIAAYVVPTVGVDGGKATLALDRCADCRVYTGVFTVGETVEVRSSTDTLLGTAIIVSARVGTGSVQHITYTLQTGTTRLLIVGDKFVSTSYTATISLNTYNPTWTNASNVVWRVHSWEADHGITVTNAASPTGGAIGMLDLLGRERSVPRLALETDSAYSARVAGVSDVVSPKAIARGVNVSLRPYGDGVIREVGSAMLPGFYFDAGASTDTVQDPNRNFAFDMNSVQRPDDEWKCLLSYAEMRGFFLVGVPEITGGVNTDLSKSVYQRVYSEVDARRAAGVSFVMYRTLMGILPD